MDRHESLLQRFARRLVDLGRNRPAAPRHPQRTRRTREVRGIATYSHPVLIYNPVAGKLRRRPEFILQRTRAALARSGLTPELVPTAGPNQAGDLARQAVGEGADLVLILGGDGTINEAATGMMHTGVPMGILPGGTANVLARELGLGLHLEQAAERLGSCRPVSIAVGRVTGAAVSSRCFLAMCGAGLDAQIVMEVNDSLKSATGKFAFWAAGLMHLGHWIPAVQVEVNGETFSCGFVLISRVRNYGGNLTIASGASLLHDDFEVVLFEGSHPFRYASYLCGVAVQRVQKLRGVHTRRAKRVDIRSASPVQIDGEFLSCEAVTVEILPDALQLLIPASYR